MNILIYLFLFIIIYLLYYTNEEFTTITFGTIPEECKNNGVNTISGQVETTLSGKCNGNIQNLAVNNCKKNKNNAYDFQFINNKLHCNPLVCPNKNAFIATDTNGNYMLNSKGDPYCVNCPNGSKMFVNAQGTYSCASCTNGVLSLDASGNVALDSGANPVCIPYCGNNYQANHDNNICYPLNSNLCPKGYILNNGSCQIQNTVTCAKGTMNSNFLCDQKTCPTNYTMDTSGNCVYNCPFGYNLNPTTKICNPVCPSNFTPVKDPVSGLIVCSNQKKCNNGYVLVNNFCTKVCLNNQIPSIDSSGNALKDSQGNYICTNVCPSGNVFANNQCISTTCPTGYVSFSDPNKNGLYCKSICPVGQIYNTKNNTCISTTSCPSYLVKNIDSSGNSICTCPANYSSTFDTSGNIICTQNCPQGLTFKGNGTNNTPICAGNCPSGYQLQIDTSNNVLCVPKSCAFDEYLNDNNTCVKICQEGFTYSNTTSTCNPIICPNNFIMILDKANPNNTAKMTYQKCYQKCGNNLIYDSTLNICVPDLNNPPCPVNYSKDVPNQQCKLINNLKPTYNINNTVQTLVY